MANRQKVRFDADDFEEEIAIDEKNIKLKEKHSLDSDEDDDGKKYDVLAEDDIEGQEEATIDYDENIQITPFNMREEMEEGHFDTDGTYIFDKTKEIHDSWIDNIDWVKVKHKEEGDQPENNKRPFEYSDDEDSDEEATKKKTIDVYDEIIPMLQPGETISAAIRRLSKSRAKIPSASQKWKNKKLKAAGKAVETDEVEIEKAKEDQKKMLELTELADKLVQRGMMEIYETTHERLSFTVKQLKEKEKASRLTVAQSMKDDDDAMDMFADDFDAKDSGKTENPKTDTQDGSGVFKVPGQPTASPASSQTHTASESSSSSSSSSSPGVRWEYKEKDEEGTEVKGPYTSSQMQEWAEDGTFGKGVSCRKVGSAGGQFYNSARIDFDLYDD